MNNWPSVSEYGMSNATVKRESVCGVVWPITKPNLTFSPPPSLPSLPFRPSCLASSRHHHCLLHHFNFYPLSLWFKDTPSSLISVSYEDDSPGLFLHTSLSFSLPTSLCIILYTYLSFLINCFLCYINTVIPSYLPFLSFFFIFGVAVVCVS